MNEVPSLEKLSDKDNGSSKPSKTDYYMNYK